MLSISRLSFLADTDFDLATARRALVREADGLDGLGLLGSVVLFLGFGGGIFGERTFLPLMPWVFRISKVILFVASIPVNFIYV